MNMLYLQRNKVLKDQANRIQVLEMNREEVSVMKVSHRETGHVHDAIGCVSSLGGIKDLGFLGVKRGMECVLSVQRASVTECVPGMSGVECISECKSAGHALTQTRVAGSLTDGRSEPSTSNKFKTRMCSGLERGKIIMDL